MEEKRGFVFVFFVFYFVFVLFLLSNYLLIDHAVNPLRCIAVLELSPAEQWSLLLPM